MYAIESMIDLGLQDGQEWPSDAHRKVAMTLMLCNPLVKTRTALNEGVQKVISIPVNRIKSVTLAELPEFGLGLCVSPNL